MEKEIYIARVSGFSWSERKVIVSSLKVKKETEKQYQCISGGSIKRINKYLIGSRDAMNNFYGLSKKEAVSNLKQYLTERRDELQKEVNSLNKLISNPVE